jgi:hypothetical protein
MEAQARCAGRKMSHQVQLAPQEEFESIAVENGTSQ